MSEPPPMPPSARALIETGRLPESLAEYFDTADPSSSSLPEWDEIAWGIYLVSDDPALDNETRGPLALLGAYAFIEMCGTEEWELVKHSEPAMELLNRAEEHGISEEEIDPLNKWAWDMYEIGTGTM